jgi:hypothetical protein
MVMIVSFCPFNGDSAPAKRIKASTAVIETFQDRIKIILSGIQITVSVQNVVEWIAMVA